MSTEISSPFDVDIAIISAVSEAAESVEAAQKGGWAATKTDMEAEARSQA